MKAAELCGAQAGQQGHWGKNPGPAGPRVRQARTPPRPPKVLRRAGEARARSRRGGWRKHPEAPLPDFLLELP